VILTSEKYRVKNSRAGVTSVNSGPNSFTAELIRTSTE